MPGPPLDAFGTLEVVVVGETILDVYVEGTPASLSREAPVPVLALAGRTEAPGGGANTALNAAALGARVRLVSAVGDDAEGDRVLALLAAGAVDVDGVVRVPGRATQAKQRVLADGRVLVRVDQGSGDPVGPATEAVLRRRVAEATGAADAVLVCDYAGGLVTPGLLAALAGARGRGNGRVWLADGRDPARLRGLRPTVATPNAAEAAALLGTAPPEAGDRAALFAARAAELLAGLGSRLAVVTLDAEGALLLAAGEEPVRVAVAPAEGFATGAGDTFAAALALALAAGAPAGDAAALAGAAAAVAVAKPGTAACTLAELRAELAPGAPAVCADAPELVRAVAAHRRRGRRLVFTNGCFDLLHRGHVAHLEQARALGDVLVVALNSDASARRLKGPGRPLVPLEDRLEVLAGLSCVDHVVGFADDHPAALIAAVRPDVFVKGGDWEGRLPGEAALVEELGGEVVVLPTVPDRAASLPLAP